MEYQKIINSLDDIKNKPCTFRTRNWVEINYDLRRTYNANSDIESKTLIRSSLCDYCDACVHFKATITVTNKQ